jgi:lamin tail-like protein
MIEFKNMMKQINTLVSALTRIYSQQGQIGKILFPGLILLLFCFLCSILISLFQLASRNSSTAVPSPNILPSAVIGPTPTALFSFGLGTFTPFPTFPAPSALPTLTSPPTGTSTPTPITPTATETQQQLPTVTSPPATVASSGSVLITAVNKAMEYVDLQNLENGPVDLQGWRLVSETGSQACMLSGVLQPNDVLRVWARKGDSGFSCGYSFNIWNDNQSDPAVLYNAQGEEVSRSP